MSDEAAGYDREWTAQTGRRTRRRVGYSHERGEVIRFVVQLEYRRGDHWEPVVRYDHDSVGVHAHDVGEDGLHLDIYRDGEKHATEFITRPVPPGVALSLAEDHLSENVQRFIRRFEEWHAE